MLWLLYLSDQQKVSEMFTLVSHFPKFHPLHLICSSQQLVYQLGMLSSARNRESGLNRWRLFFSFNKSLGIGVVAQQCHRDPGSLHLPRYYLDKNAGFSPSKPPKTAAPSITSGWKAGRRRKEERASGTSLLLLEKQELS